MSRRSAAATLLVTRVRHSAGRTLRNDTAGSVSFAWEGVQASFTTLPGTTSVVMLAFTNASGPASFHTLVDGVLALNFSISGATLLPYTIASGLDPSTGHNVTIWSIDDPITFSWDTLPPVVHTVRAFTAVGAPSCGFADPPPAKSRRLLLVGDSITAGNQIDHTTCRPDHWGTYGAKLCREFDANCTTVAISG